MVGTNVMAVVMIAMTEDIRQEAGVAGATIGTKWTMIALRDATIWTSTATLATVNLQVTEDMAMEVDLREAKVKMNRGTNGQLQEL